MKVNKPVKFKLVGFVSNEDKLGTIGEEHIKELESQAEQLFQFLYCQVPLGVVNRLFDKMKANSYINTGKVG
jgi:hypothetical protein